MLKISGLDTLTRQLEDASRAFGEIDGQLGTVSFNPHDPASIEAAIAEVEAMVDGKLGAYDSNPIVAPLAAQMKEKYRTAIIDKAAAARLAGENQ